MLFQKHNIEELISKSITSTISQEEEACLNKWLKDPYNKLQFDKIVDLENTFDNLEELDYFHSKQNWNDLNRRISRPKFQTRKWLAYAATILLPISIALTVFFLNDEVETYQEENLAELDFRSDDVLLELDNGEVFYFNHEDTLVNTSEVKLKVDSSQLSYKYAPQLATTQLRYNTIVIPKGKQYQLTLSDGTQVWLNAETKFKYPVVFTGNTREVFISNGEVFFDVTKNKDKPFIVNLAHDRVEVLGTQFNVKAYNNEASNKITLVEGSVIVGNDKCSTKLVPNQQAIINKNSKVLVVNEVDAGMFSAWKDKMFIYKNEKLEHIMMDLERHYNLKIFYEDQSLQDEQFSVSIDIRDNFNDILEMLEATGSVEFNRNDNVLVIKK